MHIAKRSRLAVAAGLTAAALLFSALPANAAPDIGDGPEYPFTSTLKGASWSVDPNGNAWQYPSVGDTVTTTPQKSKGLRGADVRVVRVFG